MVWFHRVLKFGVLAMLTAAASGCIVLPYGARGGRHHHVSDGHNAAPSDHRSGPAPEEYRRGRGR